MYNNKGDLVLTIVYDGECLFCSNYIKLQSLKKSVGKVTLLDARVNPAVVATLGDLNMDINQGMAAHYNGRWYFGAECMTLLSNLSRNDTILGNTWRALFFRPKVTAFFYPFFRAVRSITLKLQQKKAIPPPD